MHGGGGFVGAAIMRALSAAPGLMPIACLRREPSGAPRPAPSGSAHMVCDATDRDAMIAAAQGTAFAVGAVLGDSRTMVAATRNLCAAARAAGQRRIVHISSMAVYGAAEGQVREDAALTAVGPYAAAKLECEAIIRNFVAGGGEAVILRPGIVYGPGGQQWIGRFGRMLRAGRLGDLGADGDGLCNLMFHDDLGAAVVRALRVREAAGSTINLAPVSPPTWNDFLVGLARAIGATPVRRVTLRRLRLEMRLFAPPLQVAKLVAARLGLRQGWLPEPIPPSMLALMRQRIALDGGAADRLLGIDRTAWEVALAACATWFLEQAA